MVVKAGSVNDPPDALLKTAWRITFDAFARSKPARGSKKATLKINAKQVRAAIEALCTFIEDDIGQNTLKVSSTPKTTCARVKLTV